jgi:hypothetical protein
MSTLEEFSLEGMGIDMVSVPCKVKGRFLHNELLIKMLRKFQCFTGNSFQYCGSRFTRTEYHLSVLDPELETIKN